jgi:DNA primase
MKRFATNVVLAFDADKAGQGAAARFYEWEEKYQVQVKVARFPDGKDPGDLSLSDPDALRRAVDDALPFLGFRVQRVLASRPIRSPEEKARMGREAMAVVNEHPALDVRKLYAGEVALRVGLPVDDLVKVAVRRAAQPEVRVTPQRHVGSNENAEFVAVAMLLQRWNEIADWLLESLFSDEVTRRAFLAVAEAGGSVERALAAADPEARELLERAAVADLDAGVGPNGVSEPFVEASNLIAAATRRELARARATDPDSMREHSEIRRSLEELDDAEAARDAAGVLLGWLQRRGEERV